MKIEVTYTVTEEMDINLSKDLEKRLKNEFAEEEEEEEAYELLMGAIRNYLSNKGIGSENLDEIIEVDY